MDLISLLAMLAMIVVLAIPAGVIVALLRVSRQKLSGRRRGRDRFLGAMSGAAVHASHVQADMPDVDEIASPLAPRPGDRRR